MKSCNLTIDVYHHFLICYVHYRPVLPGGASNAMAPLGGADYVHQITTGTPGFSDLPTALHYKYVSKKSTNYIFILYIV